MPPNFSINYLCQKRGSPSPGGPRSARLRRRFAYGPARGLGGGKDRLLQLLVRDRGALRLRRRARRSAGRVARRVASLGGARRPLCVQELIAAAALRDVSPIEHDLGRTRARARVRVRARASVSLPPGPRRVRVRVRRRVRVRVRVRLGSGLGLARLRQADAEQRRA